MLKKIRRWYNNPDNRADLYQGTTYVLISGTSLALFFLMFEREKFHQVEAAVEEMGLTSTIVDHMRANGPY
jgi:hypothetical protein